MANDPEGKTLPGGVQSDNLAIREASDPDLSWMQRLREQRDERVEVEVLKLGMPTWGPSDRPDLAVDFGVVDKQVLEKFQAEARKRKKETGAGTDIDIKFICEAARAVYLRSPETDSLVKVIKDGKAVRLDLRLASMLGLDPDGEGKNSHTLLMYLTKNNTVALGALAVTIATWMANTSREVEDELVGE
jgi:hypothetical protein